MNTWLAVAAANGFLAVAAGAFAAHGLQGRLGAAALQTFETAARYHMYHALALGLAALASRWIAGAGLARRCAAIAPWLFLAGIVLFCGSLYLLALTGIRALAMVTPVGGIAFLAGWAALALAALTIRR
jgi:uncharacterized membrane protein YgdD (TMEM256/DUF423 family)